MSAIPLGECQQRCIGQLASVQPLANARRRFFLAYPRAVISETLSRKSGSDFWADHVANVKAILLRRGVSRAQLHYFDSRPL
jgi:hypothetical protein